MIPSYRAAFNAAWTPAKYAQFLHSIGTTSGVPVDFRLSESPIFIPHSITNRFAQAAGELILQLMTPEYHKLSDSTIPPEFHVPNEDRLPMFCQVDFGIVQGADGALNPKLVEMQAFPSLYAFQPFLAQQYIETYNLDRSLEYLMSGLNFAQYVDLLRGAIVAGHNPENVVLLEIDPLQQKTLCDFILTRQMLGIPVINIRDVKQSGREIYYEAGTRRIPIHRIYNRAIVDELQRKQVPLQFRMTDELAVEWAGHPNWFFRISKFSTPYLKHDAAPRTIFLDQVEKELGGMPDDAALQGYVLKPLFSFAGLGVVVGPTQDDITAIPEDKRKDYILQERLHFVPVMDTPHGPTKAELRMMFVWDKTPEPVCTCIIVRTGRGLQMGVDFNKNMEWVGASAALHPVGSE